MTMAMATESAALRVNLERLRGDIEALAEIGRASSGGLYRSVFSPAFEAARNWLRHRMTDAGLAAKSDAAGNLIGRLGGPGAAVMAGSHIDTVPDGGPLDGALGVLAGLECLRVIAEAGAPLDHALEVAAFADEEGHYIGCLGSRAMAGLLSADEVDEARDFGGHALAEAMRDVGLDPARVTEARRPEQEIAAYVELHIEQGPVLEAREIPIGVVDAIVGIVQRDLRFIGEPDHAGTTPMDLRKDAFMGAAEFAARARELVLGMGSEHARLTFGIVEAKPQVANIVPYETRLRQELRDVTAERLEALASETEILAAGIAERYGLGLEVEEVFRTAPERMSPRVQGRIAEACEGLGLERLVMPSGASHDAQILARVTDAGMIFVPSKGGRSHRPDEWTEWPALEHGANVLLHTLLRLAA
jgi:N-carbamoyl-L-amino-acid hydrolase